MKYKTADCLSQLKKSCLKLQEVTAYFECLSLQLGIEPTVTRVWDGVCGDSGVHEAHRAVDLRDEMVDYEGFRHFTYTAEQAQSLVLAMNEKYPRSDGKLTCLHHTFNGGPIHFHLQVEWNSK